MLGFNFAGNNANRAIIFANLSPAASAKGTPHSAQAVIGDMQRKLGAITGAIVVPFLPPPIQGQGSTGGFTFELLDKGGGTDFGPLAETSQGLTAAAMRSAELGGVFSTSRVNDPQLRVTIDREKAKSIGVSMIRSPTPSVSTWGRST